MNSQKNALTYALFALAILAAAMFAFYYVQNRIAASGGSGEEVGEEIVRGEKSEFVGTYSPMDGPLEAAGKRIAFFTVNAKEDGGFLGSLKMDTIGSSEAFFFECVDVKIDEKDFFLNCQNPSQGTVSFSGKWEKTGDTMVAAGKVLWMRQGNLILEQGRKLQLLP